jgi:hypothetical protein
MYPALADVRTIATRLRKDLKTNRKLAASFKRQPRLVLGALGLNEDVQNELLVEARQTASSCWISCIKTCWFSDCVCTNGGTIIINA